MPLVDQYRMELECRGSELVLMDNIYLLTISGDKDQSVVSESGNLNIECVYSVVQPFRP